MGEGQVVRWKYVPIRDMGIAATHKTTGYQLWNQMVSSKSRVMLTKSHRLNEPDSANVSPSILPIIYHIYVIDLIYPLPIDKHGIDR